MAADEDQPKATKPGGERRSGGDRRQRHPVTIDLKAEKAGDRSVADSATISPAAAQQPAVGDPAKAAVEPASPQEGAPHRREAASARTMSGNQRWARIVIAGVTGGIIALILIIVLQATGLLPVPGGSAANRAIEQAEAASNTASALDRRLMALEAMTEDLPSVRSDIEGLGATLSALEGRAGRLALAADLEAMKVELAGLLTRLDAMPPPVTRQELAGLASRVGRLEAVPPARGGTDGGGAATVVHAGRIGDAETELASLAGRVSGLEEKITALRAAEGVASKGDNAAWSIAVASLDRATESGEPFAAELDLLTALGVTGREIAKLRRFAKDGVETRTVLAAQFAAVADAILAGATRADPEAGFFRRLVVSARGLVSVRPTEPIAGDDPPAIVSRMQAAVAQGDLAAALAERDGLPAAGVDASAEWAARAADRVTVDGLVEAIQRAPGNPAGG